jgi:hypothetical protein
MYLIIESRIVAVFDQPAAADRQGQKSKASSSV